MSDCIINRKEAKHPQAVEPASNRTENRQNTEAKVKKVPIAKHYS